MRPICCDCQLEMEPQGPTIMLGYEHSSAPVDYSRGKKYTCADCGSSVFLPIGYAFTMMAGEPRDYTSVRVKSHQPERKLP